MGVKLQVVSYYSDESSENGQVTMFEGHVDFERGKERAFYHALVELPDGFEVVSNGDVRAGRRERKWPHGGWAEYAPHYVVDKNSVVLACVESWKRPIPKELVPCKVLEVYEV